MRGMVNPEPRLDTCQTTGSWSLITRLLPRVRACVRVCGTRDRIGSRAGNGRLAVISAVYAARPRAFLSLDAGYLSNRYLPTYLLRYCSTREMRGWVDDRGSGSGNSRRGLWCRRRRLCVVPCFFFLPPHKVLPACVHVRWCVV